MKNDHTPRGGLMIISLLAGLCSFQSVSAEERIPTGKLEIDRTLVRVGTSSQLAWKIQYKTGVTEVLDDLTPKQDLAMRVRVLGASFQQARDNKGGGNNYDGVDASNPAKGAGIETGGIDNTTFDDEIRRTNNNYDLSVEVFWSKNNSSWTSIFTGPNSKINPAGIVLDTTVKVGDVIHFGGRGYYDKDWLPLYSTSVPTPNVITLKNGDPLPATNDAFRFGLIEDYLKPYLTADGATVKIGNREILVLMELGQTDPDHYGFDLQDLAVLVTVE